MAHKRSASKLIGAFRLAALCEAIEQKAAQTQENQWSLWAEELEHNFLDVLKALSRNWLLSLTDKLECKKITLMSYPYLSGKQMFNSKRERCSS